MTYTYTYTICNIKEGYLNACPCTAQCVLFLLDSTMKIAI